MTGRAEHADRGPAALAYWFAWACAVAAFMWVWASLGLTYPVPWSDEGGFLWQAMAVMERNTLFAPELNHERHVMWMPPGYAVVTGLAFKVLGFSLSKARALSCLYLVVAVLVMAVWLRRLPLRWLHLLAIGLFLQAPATLAMANMARMETLLLCVVSLGMWCLARARPHLGLAALACSPLIHPNGAYFLVAGLVAVGARLVPKPLAKKSARADWAAPALVAILWLAYSVYVASHSEAFVHDMGFQFDQKRVLSEAASPLDGIRGPVTGLRFALWTLLWLYRRDSPTRMLLVPSAAGCVMSVTTIGNTYNILFLWVDLLLLVQLVETVAARANGLATALRPAAVGLAVATAFAAFYLQADRSWTGDDPKWDATVAGRPYSPGMFARGASARVPYHTEADAAAVRVWLRDAARTGRNMRVAFYPAADALLYTDLRSEQLQFVQPTFSDRLAVAQVFRRSRYIPAGLHESMDLRALWVHQVPTQFHAWDKIRERAGTEALLGHRRDLDPRTVKSVRW